MAKMAYHDDDAAWAKPTTAAKAKASNAPTGEAGTEFEKAGSLGPFECGNCAHMRGGACFHPVMMAKSKQPKNGNGSVKIGERDCCQFVRRVGKA